VVPTIPDCYAALSWVHSRFTPVINEFDDYIARPKPNGYQSLHTVVRDAAGKPVEVQIRTQAMHDHAEHGVAAHWAYKEAGTKGYAGVTAAGEYDAKIAVLRQLLAWERDLSGSVQDKGLFDDRIYVLTPDAAVVELPKGATPVDFAYTVHTNLGHRCRGARVDGAMVSLNTPLQNGQTVEITTVREGGPSRDWLNAELGYLVSHRARAKVRAWFNAQVLHETVARGREAVEKLLQREGKTAFKLEDLATQLGFKSADALFEVVGKDEFSLRTIETLLRPPAPVLAPDDYLLLKKSRHGEKTPKGGVLVVGVDSLMTQLARCCKPAPPDVIGGFVSRGKGVSVHRADCSNFREFAARHAERVIPVEWGTSSGAELPSIRWMWRSRPPTGRAAARHFRGVCQGEDECDRGSDPVDQGHRVDDLHGRGAGLGEACQGAGRGSRSAERALGAPAMKAARPFVRRREKRSTRPGCIFFPAILAVSDKLRRVAQLVRAPP
jgi:GTP pyrophosphokinase